MDDDRSKPVSAELTAWRLRQVEEQNAQLISEIRGLRQEFIDYKQKTETVVNAFKKEEDDARTLRGSVKVALFTMLGTGIMTALVIGIIVPLLQGHH